VVNAALAIGLAPVVGYIAAAFGTTFAGWAMTLALWIGTARMGESTRFDKRFWRRLWGILAASAVMGAELAGAVIVLGPMLGTPGLKIIALVILILSGIVTYFLAGRLFGAVYLADLRSAVRRG
jgi:putative peptidoglycan lipid II flippase